MKNKEFKRILHSEDFFALAILTYVLSILQLNLPKFARELINKEIKTLSGQISGVLYFSNIFRIYNVIIMLIFTNISKETCKFVLTKMRFYIFPINKQNIN